ncbi:MAG: DUF2283 domain-containing protein [Phycisphaeraceae bacterium]|nr:DUF2283 domain-containing protein [Phycisphaeraceae bacterium]
MRQSYFEITFRQGRPLAAYFYLPRRNSDRSVRTRTVGPGLIVDFNRSGKPIGVEITSPQLVSFTAFNRVLRSLRVPPVKRARFAPLRAA